MNDQVRRQKYLALAQKVKFREFEVSLESAKSRRWVLMKQDLKTKFSQMKMNALMGAGVGTTLGLIFSLPHYVKKREISVVVFSCLSSAFFFSMILSLGTFIR